VERDSSATRRSGCECEGNRQRNENKRKRKKERKENKITHGGLILQPFALLAEMRKKEGKQKKLIKTTEKERGRERERERERERGQT
jgi:hypothetical protein